MPLLGLFKQSLDSEGLRVTSIEIEPGHDRPLVREGRRNGNSDKPVDTITRYAYVGNGSIEYETLVSLDASGGSLKVVGVKELVREMPNQNVETLVLRPDGLSRTAQAKLTVLGHTESGGPSGEGQDSREPHARFIIDDPESLKWAFGELDLSGRQPNRKVDPTHNYLEFKAPKGGSLMEKQIVVVNGRRVTFTCVGEITLTMGLDVEGQPGAFLAAYFRKVLWREGGYGGSEMDA